MRITEIIKESRGNDKENKKVSFVGMKKVNTAEEERKKQIAQKLYDKAIKELTHISRTVIEGKSFDISSLQEIAKEFVDSLFSNHYLFLQALYREVKRWDLPIHSVNTAIIAFKIVRIGKYDQRALKALNALVLVAFFHDLGMLKVPEELRNKPGRLTDSEYNIIKKHPIETYRILKGLGDKYKKIAEIAYQEHEREDGSGYPRGLKGREIHEYAKIIGLADMYVAMIHPRPQRKRFLPFEAVKQIIAVNKRGFPKTILKSMINELSAFPLGIYVRLNTNEIGRVVATNRLAPLRPTVEILFDSSGTPLEKPRMLDLRQYTLINITEAFFKEELT